MQYPLRISDSQYYKSMIDNPPENIEYIDGKNKVGMISNKGSFALFNFLKKQIRLWTEKFNLILPNAHLSKNIEDCDIIHCAHCLSKNENIPWVFDVESLWQMWISGRENPGSRDKVLKYLKRDNCKKIIAWTKETQKDIIKKFPEIKEKVDLIYYAMPEQRMGKKNGKTITLFFSGRHFYNKGGLHATEVMDKLTKKYPNIKGVINGDIPEKIISKYSENKKLEFHQLMPYKDVLKLYRRADIFVYPGYSDTFGFGFMDAMAFGAPIVTVDGHARKEIVEDGKTGFVISRGTTPHRELSRNINKAIIQEMENKISLLIKDEKLRKTMSKNCIRNIRSGKFSLNKRNAKLEKIYRNAINKDL